MTPADSELTDDEVREALDRIMQVAMPRGEQLASSGDMPDEVVCILVLITTLEKVREKEKPRPASGVQRQLAMVDQFIQWLEEGDSSPAVTTDEVRAALGPIARIAIAWLKADEISEESAEALRYETCFLTLLDAIHEVRYETVEGTAETTSDNWQWFLHWLDEPSIRVSETEPPPAETDEDWMTELKASVERDFGPGSSPRGGSTPRLRRRRGGAGA